MVQRIWRSSEKVLKAPKFRVVSYNILSDSALFNNRHLYQHCDLPSLKWGNRFNNIKNELSEMDPDIMCFQEVDFERYFKDIYFAFDGRGYSSQYKMKNGGCEYGVSTFFKRSSFKLIKTFKINIIPENVLPNWQLNVGLVTVLEYLPHPSFGIKYPLGLVVINTHIKYAPNNEELRCQQLKTLMNEVIKIIYENEFTNYPIILCGDLNSEPKKKTLDFLLKNTLKHYKSDSNQNTRLDYKNVSNQNTPKSLEEEIEFKTACDISPTSDYTSGENSFQMNRCSTFINFKGYIVDYILYSNAFKKKSVSLSLSGYLDLPNVELLRPIPHLTHGSDHFPILSEFYIL